MEEDSHKKLDLAGQRYGSLTALAPAKTSEDETAWQCRCDCGKEVVVATQHLRNGHRTSCGCKTRKATSDNVRTGMIRNSTVRKNNTSGVPGVEWAASKRRWRASICFKGRRRYLGSFEKLEDAAAARRRAEAELFGKYLDVCDGKAPESEMPDIEKVCPPIVQDRSAQKMDLTGQRFGQLTALVPAGKKGSMSAWLCRCDCGRETVVTIGHLRNGTTTSCGCKPKVTLVDGTCVELIRSKTIRSNNTSGVTGVEWVPRTNQWKAVIFFKGKRHYLGCYGKFEDAVKARKRAEEELFEPFLREFAGEAAQQAADG